MTAQPRPLEGRIRFTTANPWDDPLFRSAIRGAERAQRRAEMQASIDKVEARRVGGQYREEKTAEPAPTPPKKAPELARDPAHPQRLAEHKEAVVAAVAKVDALLADPKTVIVADFNDEPEPEPAPVAREPIQADTPASAPACPIGEPAPATVAAEEGETTMAKVEGKKRPCGCGQMGAHRKECKLAAKQTPVTCEDCGKPFPSANARSGHMKSCPGRKGSKGAAPAKKTLKAPAAPAAPAAEAREEAALDALAVAALRFPGREIPEPPSLRCLVVRVRGAVPLEVECATPEDAAAFVRLVAGPVGAKTEACA